MRKLLSWVFVKLVQPQVGVRFCKDGNSYDHTEEKIYLDVNDNDDCGFLRHLEEKHGFAEARSYSLLVWTILHEIGHYNTLDECEEDELLVRGYCAMVDKSDVTEKVQDLYFDLESEWLATEWAIDYLLDHQKLCRVFSALLR